MADPVKMCYSRDQGAQPRPRVTFTAPSNLMPGATFSGMIIQDDSLPGHEKIICLLKCGDDVKAQCYSKPFKKGIHQIHRVVSKPPDCIIKFKTTDVQNLMSCFPLD
ncbi:hypothetical protein Btru_023053 [Bulinus truncatus]|nr:hypothetical protein Btru_023053 [Bulinus truncatus]